MAEEQKLVLISKEGENFEVNPRMSEMSILLSQLLEDTDDFSEPIPLPTVSSRHLRLIIDYCELHNFSKAQTDIVHPLPSTQPSEFIRNEREREFIL